MKISQKWLGLFVVSTAIGDPSWSAVAADLDTVVFELAAPIANPENFNWFSRDSRRDGGAHQAMWEPLFILDLSTGKLEPWLALSLTTTDQQEWVLKLRPEAKWSDGEAFTADDVVFTAKMVIEYYAQLPAAEALTFARNFILPKAGQNPKVEKVDELTVRFLLKEANPRFALENFGSGLFSAFMIMPEHRWKKVRTDEGPPADFLFKAPIGTGPYKLEELPEGADANKEVRWGLDPGWWGSIKDKDGKLAWRTPPQPEHLVWKYFGSEQDSVTAVLNGELDAPVAYSPQAFAEVTKSGKAIGWDPSGLAWNDPCARQLDINVEHEVGTVNKVKGPWTSAVLRRALSLLIDRTALARDGYAGTTTPSTTMFADYGAMRPFIDAIETANYGVAPNADIAAATELLEKAGYKKSEPGGKFTKDGKVLTATITVNEDIAGDLTAVANLEKQLENAGLNIVVQGEPNANYWGQVIPKGKYEMAYGWLACGSVAEPYTSMSRYLAAKAVDIDQRTLDNTGRWRTDAAKRYSEIVEEIGALALDDPTVPGLVAEAYAELAGEMPIVPLVQSPRIFAFGTSRWTGWPNAEACRPPLIVREPAPAPGPAPAPEPSFAFCTVPMHDWAATHRLLFNLHRVSPAPGV